MVILLHEEKSMSQFSNKISEAVDAARAELTAFLQKMQTVSVADH